MKPRDAAFLGIGALVYPVVEHIVYTALGRNVLDPFYRRNPR